MNFKDEYTEKENILNQETKVNDKDLIKRIFKNSRKSGFDYFDALSVLKNKPFLMVQLIAILFIVTFISLIAVTFGYDYGYIALSGALIYVALIYTKFMTIEKKVNKILNDNDLKDIKAKISAKWYELFLLMERIPIDRERIEYNRKKFELKIAECVTNEDYEKILEEILNEIEKYNSVSGNFEDKEPEVPLTYLSKEISDAYYELGLPPGSKMKEVKSKYRELMKKYHPDSTHFESEKARKLNIAYNTLKEFLGPE